ncbi:hypothetical protein SGFS_017360 [Streptomyces graminofaciens]|uniref:Uncharacterized protein n=1 Tax=Streptomyces graminofaciens TaxID=68212 RepID=A0ABN5VB43_9ACTN|nr:hypothetical protein SGFS_017360 [Streptomyces graminofaciens]
MSFGPETGARRPAWWGGGLEATQNWDVSSGRTRATLTSRPGVVHSVAFSPDGKTLATGSDDEGTVRVDLILFGIGEGEILGQASPGNGLRVLEVISHRAPSSPSIRFRCSAYACSA